MSPRVLVLASEFPPGPGGIGTHAQELAQQLQRHAWDVAVAATQDFASDAEIRAFNARASFPIARLARFGAAPVKLAYRLAVVARLIRRFRPNLLVASGERMVWLAALLPVPYVAIGHAMEFNVPARWQRRINRAVYSRARAVICVSEYTRARMLAAGVRVDHSGVIPNGGDDGRFAAVPRDAITAFRRAHGLDRARLLVTVGSVHERKGQDVVIRALPAVLARFPDVHYLCIGQPLRRESFADLARELGVAAHVHFLGVVPAATIVQALSAAELFVMASQHTADGDFEGFGIAVVEAALCGLPAIVTDNSGVMEAIEPGETGLVAAISDPVSLADRLSELLADPARRLAMGRLARERAIARKTWNQRGAEYDRLLRAILAGVNASSDRID